MSKHYDFSGKTVLITGGSMGIGETFARTLHASGAKPVLVARSHAKLARVASELPGAQFIAEDLARPGAAQRVFQQTRLLGLTVDVLINNAGFGAHGSFAELTLPAQGEQLDLNIKALVELTHLFLPELTQRRGGLINVASTAAFQPVPYMAVYAATKAFVLSFTEALWAEHHGQNLRVLALCPGATETPFFERAGEGAAFGAKASPEDVVRAGLSAFQHNRPYVVQGTRNWVSTLLARWFTRAFVARVTAAIMRPRRLALNAELR